MQRNEQRRWRGICSSVTARSRAYSRTRPKSGPRNGNAPLLPTASNEKAALRGGFPRALCRTRTGDPFLTMEVLYQLS